MAPSSQAPFRVGTRVSALARTQTQTVVSLLRSAWPQAEFETQHFSTRGDEVINVPLPSIGGKGLFTERLEQALRNHEIDFAVHSLKDLPVEPAPGLAIGAILERADPSDVLVTPAGMLLEDLPHAAIVGTSSTRRQAQILALRPDLAVRSIRGNVETRVGKVITGEYDAVVLAAAGISRLGLKDIQLQPISFQIMLPAPGQGALAVQCRDSDERVLSLLAALEDARTRSAVVAERAFLSGLGGGCSAPIAAFAYLAPVEAGGSSISLRGRVLSPDGTRSITVEGSGSDAAELGKRLAVEAGSRGARAILTDFASPLYSDPAARPLSGRRIVVTRAANQADEAVRELESRGAQALVVPTIRIVAETGGREIDAALDNLESYAWIIFSSTNGVDQFFARLTERNRIVPPGTVRIGAVGPSTRAELERRGARVDFVPSAFTSDCLGRELPEVQGGRVLYVTARNGSSDAERALVARGADVYRLPVYRTEIAELTSDQIRTLSAGVDAILLTSGSTADGIAAALGADSAFRKAFLETKPVICCIGPSTAAAARRRDLPVNIEAPVHTIAGMVDALEQYYGERIHGA